MTKAEVIQEIRRVARSRRISMREFSRVAGIPLSTLNSFLQDERQKMKPRNVAKLASLLSIPFDSLMDSIGQKAFDLRVKNAAGKMVAAAMTAKDIPIEKLAKAGGFHPICLHRILKERNYKPKPRTMEKIASVLDIPLKEFAEAIKSRPYYLGFHQDAVDLYDMGFDHQAAEQFLYPKRPEWVNRKGLAERDKHLQSEFRVLRREFGFRAKPAIAILGSLTGLTYSSIEGIIYPNNSSSADLDLSSRCLRLHDLILWLYPERPGWIDEKAIIRNKYVESEEKKLTTVNGLSHTAARAVLGKLINIKPYSIKNVIHRRRRVRRLMRSGNFLNA